MIEEQQNEKWSLSLISGALDRHEQRKIKEKALISLIKIWMDYFFERNPENFNNKDHFFDSGELFAKKFLNELAKQEDVFKRNDIIHLFNDLQETTNNMYISYKEKKYSKFYLLLDRLEELLDLK